jgi:GNAT superfamily N-acetyltransferase
MITVRELLSDETDRAAAALLELRPQFKTPEAIAARVEEQRADGYRIVASFEDGAEHAACAAGFRVGSNLPWGRHIYVDDLVTRPALRGRGHADAVMNWLLAEAKRLSCEQVHLDSAVVAERQDAHRFYFNHGFRISGYHFQRAT